MQCCGENFASGGVVSWSLMEADPEDYGDIVGEERAAELDLRCSRSLRCTAVTRCLRVPWTRCTARFRARPC
ncbi:DUF6578 domain-containing protein [Streptomyces globisporus]|uniref:DUF6578 domain-containing protein n=1 Tax=Streptomyces TaxID=1883 RepID=UPI003681E175